MAIGCCMVTADGKRDHLPNRYWPYMGDYNLPWAQPCLRAYLSFQKYFRSLPHSIAYDPLRFCGHASSAIDHLCDGDHNACARSVDWRISTTIRRVYRGWPRYRAGLHCSGGVVGAGNVISASGPVATPACSNITASQPAYSFGARLKVRKPPRLCENP